MINKIEDIYQDGKKSLASLLREKAYVDVQENLENKGIDINEVSEEDIETLVADKAKEYLNGIQGFSVGTAFTIAISLISGV
jgi:hypothetical protein